MMTSRCYGPCGAAGPPCALDYFPSPCMCTTTGTTTFAAQKEERDSERRQEVRR